MKKRIISVILVLSVILSSTITVFAEEETPPASETYYDVTTIISLEYQDKLENGSFGDTLEHPAYFMIPGDKSGLYIKAEELDVFLDVSGFPVNYGQTHTQCSLVCPKSDYAVIYNFKSDKTDASDTIKVYVAGSIIEYPTKLPAIYSKGVAWIPFEITMELFNMEYSIADGKIKIERPSLSGLMGISSICNKADYSFDWAKEVRLNAFAHSAMKGGASVLNGLGGLFSRQSHAFCDLVTLNQGNFTEKHYAKRIAALYISPTSSEVITANENQPYLFLDMLSKLFEADVKSLQDLSSLLTYDNLLKYSTKLASAEGPLKNSRKILSFINILKTHSGTIKKACDMFSKVLNKFDTSLKYFNFLIPIKYFTNFIGFAASFANKDKISVSRLTTYANATDAIGSEQMSDFANTQGNNFGKIFLQFLDENIIDMIVDGLSVFGVLKGSVSVFLLGWDLANLNPELKAKLDGADNFELTESAIYYQNDARDLMQSFLNETIIKGRVIEHKLPTLYDYAYSYLKFSIIARNGAGAVVNLSSKIEQNNKDTIANEIDAKNKDIGMLLNALETDADFLPSSISEKEWKYPALINFIEANCKKIDKVKQNYVPISELVLDENSITPQEAIEIVKELQGGKLNTLLTNYMLETMTNGELKYDYTVLEDVAWVKTKGTHAYIVRMGPMHKDEESYDDICIFVRLDGSEAWCGLQDEIGEYYCYTDIDLLNFNILESIESIKKIYVEGSTSGLVKIDEYAYE